MIGNLDESNSDLTSDLEDRTLAKKKLILKGKRVRVSPKISNAQQKMKPELPKLVSWKEYEEIEKWLKEEASLGDLEKFAPLTFSSDPAKQRIGIMILKRVLLKVRREGLIDNESRRKILSSLTTENEPILQIEALAFLYSVIYTQQNFEEDIPSIKPLNGLLKSPHRLIVFMALMTNVFLNHDSELFRTRFLHLGGVEQITLIINKTTDKFEITSAVLALLSVFHENLPSFEEIRFIIPTLCSLLKINNLFTQLRSQIARILTAYCEKPHQLKFILDTSIIKYITSNLNHDT